MSDEVLKALGELTLRCQMAERANRDLEVKVKRQRRAIKKLSFYLWLEYVSVLLLAIGMAALAKEATW